MVQTFTELTINHLELLFAEEGKPDGLFFYEDMGFKNRPFMSPAMYAEIIQPGHKRLFDFAHSLGCKVIVHSCGYVAPLVPGLIEAGMDCLQAMEVKAGMDLPTLFKDFGDRIAFYGGVDVRTLISNDRAQIDAEMAGENAPRARARGRLHPAFRPFRAARGELRDHALLRRAGTGDEPAGVCGGVSFC